MLLDHLSCLLDNAAVAAFSAGLQPGTPAPDQKVRHHRDGGERKKARDEDAVELLGFLV
jgi:hypothetical protein